jgi:hypothetical protein
VKVTDDYTLVLEPFENLTLTLPAESKPGDELIVGVVQKKIEVDGVILEAGEEILFRSDDGKYSVARKCHECEEFYVGIHPLNDCKHGTVERVMET